MKIKPIPAAVVTFLLISALNTCQSYQIKRESKTGRRLEKEYEEFIDGIYTPIDEEQLEKNIENTIKTNRK